ncbi:MAG: hypothetical protein V3U92_12985 [Cellulophaga sp.]
MKNHITLVILLLATMVCKAVQQETTNSELSAVKKILFQKKGKLEEINPQIPDKYVFDYKLTTESKANGKTITIYYMVKPGASYYGMVIVRSKKDFTKNSITIKDIGRSKSITLLKRKNKKYLRIVDIPQIKDKDSMFVSIKRIAAKEILGYTCQGYIITTKEGSSTLYSTQDAAFGFNLGFGISLKLNLKDKEKDSAILKELQNRLLMERTYQSNDTLSEAVLSKITLKEITKIHFNVDLSKHKR